MIGLNVFETEPTGSRTCATNFEKTPISLPVIYLSTEKGEKQEGGAPSARLVTVRTSWANPLHGLYWDGFRMAQEVEGPFVTFLVFTSSGTRENTICFF